MKYRFYNIQGFLGDFSYEVDTPITIIDSKYNGVGKTTLFDCLKFLADSKSVDKDERDFFKNLEANEAVFSVENKDGIINGFFLRDKDPVVFFRVEGEDTVTQDENFPNAAAEIGLLQLNGTLLNIFDKEVNLFSKSSYSENYGIVKALTTHEPTEQMKELIQQSIEYNGEQRKKYMQDISRIQFEMGDGKYYTQIDKLEELVSNDNYLTWENSLEQMKDSLTKSKPVGRLNVSAVHPHLLIELLNEISRLVPTNIPIINSNALIDLFEVRDYLTKLNQVGKLPDFQTDFLNSLSELRHLNLTPAIPINKMNEDFLALLNSLSFDQLKPVGKVESLDRNLIELISEVKALLNSLKDTQYTPFDTNIIYRLQDLGKLATTIRINNDRIIYQQKEANKMKETLNSTRVACPIRQEVYLVNGECQY